MIFIIITTIIIYFLLIAWTWQSLGTIEKNKKIMYTVIGLITIYIITLIIFQITKNGINYQNAQIQGNIRNVIVLIFTGINGIIIMPQVGRILEKINDNQMKQNELKKKILILIAIFIICIIFEIGYMKNMQEGIISIYNSNLKR